MPQLEVFRPSDELRIRVKKIDSAGRTPEQVDAMGRNEIRPYKLSEHDQAFAHLVAEEQTAYPKVMYQHCLKNGKPAGDEIAPSYPLPFDLAQMIGVPEGQFKVIGKTRDSGGYVVLKHPYRTKSVGVVRHDGSVDLEASQKQEKALRKEGWVDRIQDIVGLPEMISDNAFDPVPFDPVPLKA